MKESFEVHFSFVGFAFQKIFATDITDAHGFFKRTKDP
jgi:hypothetical protein